MGLSNLGVREEVSNSRLPFKGLKRGNNLQLIYSKVWLASLETKKQKGRKECFSFKKNCTKQCTPDLLRGWNAPSKLWLIYVEGLKDQETYGLWFWRLNNIEKVTRDDFTGRKALSKVETMYLVLKLIKA